MDTLRFNYLLNNLNDNKCYDEFHDEIYPLLIIYGRSIFKDKTIAEDVAQDILLFFISRKKFKYVQRPNSWLYALCKYNGKKYFSNDLPLNEEIDYIEAISSEMPLELKETLCKLTSLEANIIILKWFYGFSLSEIAKQLDKTYFSVQRLHNRTIKKLEKLLS